MTPTTRTARHLGHTSPPDSHTREKFQKSRWTVIQLSLPEGERTDSNMTGPSTVVGGTKQCSSHNRKDLCGGLRTSTLLIVRVYHEDNFQKTHTVSHRHFHYPPWATTSPITYLLEHHPFHHHIPHGVFLTLVMLCESFFMYHLWFVS